MSAAASGREVAEGLTPATGQSLRSIAGAMGAGIALLVGVIVYMSVFSARAGAPAPQSVRLVNLFTAVSMGFALAAIVASEFLWRAQLRGAEAATVNGKALTAFVIRSALRECAALLGCVTALLAAQGGVLRVYPAYWANLAPAVLFWSYLFLHWPSDENLKAEVADAHAGLGT